MKAALALLLAAAACAHRPPPMQAPNDLAAAETAFAEQSVREDMRAAFMAHFAAEGLFVRDGWTRARDYLAPRPAPPIVLQWRPVHVEVASSGELGLSTGPWKLSPRDKPQAPPAFGQFVSLWRRDAAGAWKVIVDLGIGHPGPALWEAPLVARTTPRVAAAPSQDLAQAEEAFQEALARHGMRAAYGAYGAEDLRLYRDGRPPALGRAAAIASTAAEQTAIAWRVEAVEAARSGDFGYARGSYSAPGSATPLGYYVRAWRREPSGWRIALDVAQGAPPR